MKKMLSSLLCPLLLSLSAATWAAQAPIPTPPSVPTNGYILIDHDSGRVLAEQRSDERMEPASITKVMTAYIVFTALKEKRLALSDTVKVSEYAWRKGGAMTDGSTSFLELVSEVPWEVLIQGMIVQSGNDATIALAEKSPGTEDGFVQIMNEYAKRLGLAGHALREQLGWSSPEQYSTARDIAALGSALIREFPEYYKWYSQREFTWNKPQAAEPQWPAGAHAVRRRHQDRATPKARVLPWLSGQPQWHAPDFRGPRSPSIGRGGRQRGSAGVRLQLLRKP